MRKKSKRIDRHRERKNEKEIEATSDEGWGGEGRTIARAIVAAVLYRMCLYRSVRRSSMRARVYTCVHVYASIRRYDVPLSRATHAIHHHFLLEIAVDFGARARACLCIMRVHTLRAITNSHARMALRMITVRLLRARSHSSLSLGSFRRKTT